MCLYDPAVVVGGCVVLLWVLPMCVCVSVHFVLEWWSDGCDG